VGFTLTPLRHSQGLVSPPDFQRDWKADRYGILGAIALSKWLLQLAQKPPPTWANGLANSIAISKPTAPLLAGESRRDLHRIRRLSRHFLPQYRRQIRVRNRMRRHHYLAFRSRPPKADDLSRNIKAKGWE